MAMLGETKSGKSTLATQLTMNQKNTDQIVVYCLIAKRRSDIDTLLSRLSQNEQLDKVIVVVATFFESIITNYLAPYVACALGEFLWQRCDQDVIVVYDDLTSHAHAYREISLLSGVSPGRDSYPGDMFFAHSSLLERAGRISSSGKTLTSIPVVHAAGGDITAYLPTNIMSITDGQWVLDMETFRSGIRPALNIGLSVTRAGGLGHNKRQKDYAARTLKILAAYRQAEEYSHFGAELATEAKRTLVTGRMIYDVLNQGPLETFSLMAQQLMFDIVLNLEEDQQISVQTLKLKVKDYTGHIKDDADFDKARDALKKDCLKKNMAPLKTGTVTEPTKETSGAKS
jgi:F-type H+-transporting ATPase subunit alpha